jgi:EAL and modified HD-GYP domain-containing signal transduction protein
MALLGYELLFRGSNSDETPLADDAHDASQVVNALMDIGMAEIVGRNLAFINFDRTLIMSDCCELLPGEHVVVEILERLEPDPAVIGKLEQLRVKGYRIAFDEFVCDEHYLPLLQVADFVKVDVSTDDRSAVERKLSAVRNYPVKLIACQVDTREQVRSASEIGFQYFQGHFFCRPQNRSTKALPANRLATIRLLTELNQPNIKMQELEKTISQDVSLSYKLLRYINSAMCGLDRQVESIRHAIILVGIEKIRIWASLIVLSRFGEIPKEIILTGSIRARMCELLAAALGLARPERSFLIGLFSLLDAILDRPLEEVVPPLPLSPDLQDALLTHRGELGAVLQSVIAHERRQWTEDEASIQLARDIVQRSYMEAVIWSARMMRFS